MARKMPNRKWQIVYDQTKSGVWSLPFPVVSFVPFPPCHVSLFPVLWANVSGSSLVFFCISFESLSNFLTVRITLGYRHLCCTPLGMLNAIHVTKHQGPRSRFAELVPLPNRPSSDSPNCKENRNRKQFVSLFFITQHSCIVSVHYCDFFFVSESRIIPVIYFFCCGCS